MKVEIDLTLVVEIRNVLEEAKENAIKLRDEWPSDNNGLSVKEVQAILDAYGAEAKEIELLSARLNEYYIRPNA